MSSPTDYDFDDSGDCEIIPEPKVEIDGDVNLTYATSDFTQVP